MSFNPSLCGLAFAVGAATASAAWWLMQRRRSGSGDASMRFVPPPHPDWRPGETQQPPFDADDLVTLDPACMDKATLYPLMISAVRTPGARRPRRA